MEKSDRQTNRIVSLQVVDLTSPKRMQSSTTASNITSSVMGNVTQCLTRQSATRSLDIRTLVSQNLFNSTLNPVDLQPPRITTIAALSSSTIPDRNSDTIVGTTIPVDNVDAIDDADIVVLDIEPHDEYKAQFQHDIPSKSTLISPIENLFPNPPSRPKRHLHNRIIYDGELIQPRKRRRHHN